MNRKFWTHFFSHGLFLFGLLIPMLGMRFLPTDDAYDHFVTTKLAIDSLLGRNAYTFDWILNPIYKTVFLVFGTLYVATKDSAAFQFFPLLALGALLIIFYFAVFYGLKTSIKYEIPVPLLAACTGYVCMTFYSPIFYWGFVSFLMSIPFAILTFFLFERQLVDRTAKAQCSYYLFFVFSYFCHPISIFFLGIYLTIRTLFALGSRHLRKPAASTLAASGLLLLCLQKFCAYQDMAMDKEALLQSWLHPFRPLSDLKWMYHNTFWNSEVWFPSNNTPETHLLFLIPLASVALALFLSFSKTGKQKTYAPLFITVFIGHIVLNLFHDNILPVKLPFILFYRVRMEAFVTPLLLAGFFFSFLQLAKEKDWFKYQWVFTGALFVLIVHHTSLLRTQFVDFNENAKMMYETHSFHLGTNHLLPNQRYSFNHIRKTACLWENICHPENLEEEYFLTTNKSGIIPITYRGPAGTR